MQTQKCFVCEKDADKQCGVCLSVSYCSKGHQIQHWPEHKTTCRRPFKIAKVSKYGRHLVAARDIKVGEVVLKERMLLRAPKHNSSVVCLACLKPITEENSSPCEKCDWPLCLKESCRQSEEHLPECNWASIRTSPVEIKDYQAPITDYSVIYILRLCYARLHQPELWSLLRTMETHTAKRRHTFKYNFTDSMMARKFLTQYDLDDLSEEDIKDMMGIIQVNAFQTKREYWVLFNLASLIEHSCLPNCNSQAKRSDDVIIIRACQDIAQGEHFSISYTFKFCGTISRFHHILENKYFSCRCIRCSDNTEMGSYFNAILCENRGCLGPMLPKSLCDLSPATLWTCEHCGATTPNEMVQMMLVKIHSDISMIIHYNYSDTMMFLEKLKKFLHPNHYCLFMLEKNVIQVLIREKGYQGANVLTDDKLNVLIECCRHVSDLLAIVSPGEWRYRSLFKFYLFECLNAKARRMHSQNPGKAMEILFESLASQGEAYRFNTYQPDDNVDDYEDFKY